MSDIFSTSAQCKTQQLAWEVRFLSCKIVTVTCPMYLEVERGFFFIAKCGNCLKKKNNCIVFPFW